MVTAGLAWAAYDAASPAHQSGRAGSRVASRSTQATRGTAADGLVLQVVPAPYQLPSAISRAVVLTDPGRGLLIAGGLTTRSSSTRAVTLLDPVTGQASPSGPLAVATHDAGGALLNGRPFVFGGGSASSTAIIQAATPASTRRGGRGGAAAAWPVTGHLPTARSDLSAVTAGSRAYLVGGYDGTSYAMDVLATADGTRFSVAARLPIPVRYPAVAALGAWIWVFGGQTPAGATDAIQQVDTSTGRATVIGRLPAPLAHAAAFTLGGRVYVAGGQTAPAAGRSGIASPSAAVTTSGEVLQYQPGPRTTHVVGWLPVPVENASAAVSGGTAYLVGGDENGVGVPAVTTFRLVPAASALPADSGAMIPAGQDSPATTVSRAPWLTPARGPGHLIAGSDPSVLPGDVLIADHLNNRLLIVDPQGRIRWEFPRRGDLARGQTFLVPDDAFFSPDGRYIIATEEDDFVISVIDVATSKIIYRYGTPGVPGSGANHLDNPDDAMLTPDGDVVSADIKNCRIVTIAPPAHRLLGIIGEPGGICVHDPPRRFGSPNGAFPLPDGRYLITEINGDWADEMSLGGHVYWSAHPPGVAYPSDSNEIYPGRYLTVDYSDPGQVVEFNSSGRLLWRFGGLNQPSLALPLPNGDLLLNDDYNDRVIVIDPLTNRIVWQYGHTGVAGAAPGYLHDPDGVDLVPPDSLLITHAATMGQPLRS